MVTVLEATVRPVHSPPGFDDRMIPDTYSNTGYIAAAPALLGDGARDVRFELTVD